MQYLLSEDELNNLTDVANVDCRNSALEAARMVIVKLAGIKCGEIYCDRCPISDIGFYNYEDPERISHEDSRLICSKSRRYGK